MSVFHIAVREVRALMTSTVGWLVLAGFLLGRRRALAQAVRRPWISDL